MALVPIKMPQLGESIAEATIVRILFNEGEQVQADTDLIEVETNKAVMAVTAPCSGTLHEIAAEAGMDAAVVRRLIGSQADCETVAAMGNEARMMGITGVPSVVIGGAHVVVGAQPADVWLRIIDDIAAHPDRWT